MHFFFIPPHLSSTKAHALQWLGHVLRAEDNPLKMAMNFEERATKKSWKQKVKYKKSSKRKNASNRTNWRKYVWKFKVKYSTGNLH